MKTTTDALGRSLYIHAFIAKVRFNIGRGFLSGSRVMTEQNSHSLASGTGIQEPVERIVQGESYDQWPKPGW